MKDKKSDPPPIQIRRSWPRAELAALGFVLLVISSFLTFLPGFPLAFLLLFFGLGSRSLIQINLVRKRLERLDFFWGKQKNPPHILTEIESDSLLVLVPIQVENEDGIKTYYSLSLKSRLRGIDIETFNSREEAMAQLEELSETLNISTRIELEMGQQAERF